MIKKLNRKWMMNLVKRKKNKKLKICTIIVKRRCIGIMKPQIMIKIVIEIFRSLMFYIEYHLIFRKLFKVKSASYRVLLSMTLKIFILKVKR